MQQLATGASQAGLAVLGARRNGIDRLSLVGRLDVSTAPILQRELDSVSHPGGALVLDLGDLTEIDRFGVRALERASEHSKQESWRLCLVNCRGAVRRTIEEAGLGHLLDPRKVSDMLDVGDEGWPPISLPSFLGQRKKRSTTRGRP